MSKREIKRSSDKVFKGSQDSSFYGETYFLRGDKSNYGCGDNYPYDESYLKRDRQTVQVFVNSIPNLKSAIVLGCARGYMVQAFKEVGVEAVGVDISEWAVENCAEGYGDSIYCGDICDLSQWKDGEFTLAVALDVFEHISVPDLYKAIGEACRVAEWVVINVPINPDDKTPDMSSGQDESHVSIYSKTWWIEQFMAAGHDPVDVQEHINPRKSSGSRWSDEREHSLQAYFRKSVKVAVKQLPMPTIHPNSKNFKILWWSNGPFVNCFDYETEVLTKNGWKRFNNLELTDEVATLHPATHEIQYFHPEAIIDEPYSGQMYYHESKHLSIMCTPNHNLYVSKDRKPIRLVEAKNIFGVDNVEHMAGCASWEGEDKPKYEITSNELYGNERQIGYIDTELFVEWLGWYIAEGSYTIGSKGEYIVGLALNHKEEDKVYDLCTKTFPSLTWFKTKEEKKTNLRTYSKILYNYVKKLGRSNEKFIPQDIKNLSTKYLHKLLDSLVEGDGCIRKSSKCYITVSERLRDDVQEIAIKLGYATNYYKHHPKGGEIYSKSLGRKIKSNYNSWFISIREKTTSPRPHQGKFIEEWVPNTSGRVYCAVVPPNHIMCVRRNGKVYFSGNTGYGVGTKYIVYPLNQYYDVSCLAYYGLEGAALTFNGLKVFPKLYDQFGIDAAKMICDNWKPDIMVTLFDIWIGDSPLYNGQRDWFTKIHPRWVPQFPVDHYPIPVPILNQARQAYHAVAMSKFGYKELQRNQVNCSYIPHGVNTKVYVPTDNNEEQKKWLVETCGRPLNPNDKVDWSKDSFVIGKVAANKDTSRKGFDRELAGFKIFLDQNPDAKKDARLYWHTDPRFPGGFHLDHYAHLMGVDEYIMYTHPFYNYGGVSEQNMAKMYQSFNILTGASRNEGFGIPLIESQSCGIPCVVTDSTSMPELVQGHGWVVKPITWEPTALLSNQFIPDEWKIADAYGEAYNDPDKVKRLGLASRDFAEQYDWNNVVVPMWVKLVEQLREGIRPKDLSERRMTL